LKDKGRKKVAEEFKDEEKVAVRIDGLPWRAQVPDIELFFEKYNLVPGSIILGKDKYNKFNGLGSILFEST
jgi:hypothetical protein